MLYGPPRCWWLSHKESTCNIGDARDVDLTFGSGKLPQRRAWQPSPVFFLGKLYGQRSPVGYGPWGCWDLDIAMWLNWTELKIYSSNVTKTLYFLTNTSLAPSNQHSVLCFYELDYFRCLIRVVSCSICHSASGLFDARGALGSPEEPGEICLLQRFG